MINSESKFQEKRSTAKKRMTIKDVASKLGLSKSTVSRALNGYEDISIETRQKVKQTADEMGYKPMVQAQAIRSGLVRSVGVILNAEGDYDFHTYLSDLLDGISRRAFDHHWTVTVSTAPNMQGALAMMKRLSEERAVDGFILPRTKIDDARINYLRDIDMPFVMYGRTEADDNYSWFDIDSETAMKDAVLILAALGHRRIGFINGIRSYTYARMRLRGYRAGLELAGLSFDTKLIRNDAVSKADGLKQGRNLLQQPDPPSAVVCALDIAALGLYEAAKEDGLQIGRDLSVISYDGIREGVDAKPALTTFAVDHKTAGSAIVDLLIEQLRGSKPELLHKLVKAQFVERQSIGPYVAL